MCVATAIKPTVLALLVLQNTAAVQLLRYSRTRDSVPPADILTVVLMTELVKIIASMLWVLLDAWYEAVDETAAGAIESGVSLAGAPADGGEAPSSVLRRSPFTVAVAKGDHVDVARDVLRRVKAHVFAPGAWHSAVPAVLFTIQNNLLFVALANLESTTFQVAYQSRLFFTATFMTVMLGRVFSLRQWLALGALFVGVVLTQLTPAGAAAAAGAAERAARESVTAGLAAVFACGISSSFAAVYMESLVKDAAAMPVSARNVHLAVFSAASVLVWSFFVDLMFTQGDGSGADLAPPPLLHGFDVVVWIMVFNQACGGLLVAVAVKWADNILKTMATTIAIIVNGIISAYFFDFAPSNTFLLGAATVIVSVAVYNIPVVRRAS